MAGSESAGAMTSDSSKLRVSCVGDSITHGYGMDVPSTQGCSSGACLLMLHVAPLDDRYPAILQRLLGDEYVVSNFGNDGKTMTF